MDLERLPWWILHAAARIRLLGWQRYCPVCRRHSRKFMVFGIVPRNDACCPWCFALERHRLVWHFFQQETDLFDGRAKSMLHVAPEDCLEQRLRPAVGSGYLSADLKDPRAMEKMDITDIRYPDDHFDVIYCSHVLEHVVDDRSAMAELHRVLKPNGWAVLQVPVTAKATLEDAEVTDPRERLRLFGQEDHVRRYGVDVAERFESAGFEVKRYVASDFLEPGEARRIAVASPNSGNIFFCTKPEP